ncbi:MAG: alcohol dehydrogenase catalytic domain-containing protein [Patescibacteria group bacterium]|nr:alcohol dehydrogenase catalytic domain-containing protein [Patescibacteria group bacterium]
MKAFQFFGKFDLRLVELPEPSVGEGEVLLKIKKAGICGTDLHIYSGGMPVETPLVLGHEFVGDVAKAGKDVTRVKVGDRAVAEHVIGCGKCLYCLEGKRNLCKNPTVIGLHRQGALAEYLVLPQELVYPLPQELSYDEGVLAEPLSIAVYAVRKADVRVGDSVAVIGQGPIGLAVDQIAKGAGAAVFGFDRHDNRLKFARDHQYIRQGFNITEPDFIDAFKEALKTDGADAVFEAVGSEQSLEMALELARPAGKVLVLGVFEHNARVNMMQIVRKELTVQGSWTCVFSFDQTLNLLKSKSLDVGGLITNRYPFADTPKAFEDAFNGKGNRIKTVIEIG